jgi:16S rRNA processing protein RimM
VPQPKRLIETAGPEPGTPLEAVRLHVGNVVGTHGVRGELKVQLLTDDPEHLATVKFMYLGDEQQPRRVRGYRLHAGHALIRLEGITTPEEGRRYVGLPLRISGRDARPLAPGEFYLYQLIGLRVLDEAGNEIGRLTDVLETGANDVFVVTDSSGREHLFPHHADVVLDVRPDEGYLVVRPLRYYGEESEPEP